MKVETIWKNFLDEISKQLNPISYQVWFSELQLVYMDKEKIIIQVPMLTHKNTLSNTYYLIIKNVFLALTGIDYEDRISFILEEENNIVDKLNNEIDERLDWQSNLNPELTFENYVVGSSNKLAFIAANTVANSPGTIHNPLFIYGKSGLGKTHLMHAIGNYIMKNSNKKVLYVTSDEFMTDYSGFSDTSVNSLDYANQFKSKYRNVDVLIIDDIQFLVGAEKTQQEFFNTFNYLHRTNKQIIISSDRSPDDLKKLEERLRSRFMWGLPVDIYPPDFELRCRIIEKKLNDSPFKEKIDKEVIEYIANACPSDIRHIEGSINRLRACVAMYVPEKIDLEFAVDNLKDFVNKNVYVESNISKIQKTVADFFNISIDDLKGKKRNNKVVIPRQIAMYLCRMETNETFPKIGLEFGGRDHSTVIFACDKIEKELKENLDLTETIKKIKSQL